MVLSISVLKPLSSRYPKFTALTPTTLRWVVLKLLTVVTPTKGLTEGHIGQPSPRWGQTNGPNEIREFDWSVQFEQDH